MKKTITFTYKRKEYTTEVSRSSNGYPVIYTAFFWDDALRNAFIKLTFYQETPTSDILPSVSHSPEESQLKKIILEEIVRKRQTFDHESADFSIL